MKTDTVNTEKWRVEYTHSENGYKKGWHIITGKYDDVIDLPNGSEAQQTGELIVTAVNACKEINPDNPLNVAKVIVDMYEALVEASNLFDNFPQLSEMKGTFEVIWNAINKANSINK